LIDLHSHVLPAFDDGAPDESTAIAMCRMAAESGTTDLVLTPHCSNRYPFDPERVEEARQELQTAVGTLIHLHRGCDLHLSMQNIEAALSDPARFTINGHNYLLVEFSDELLFQGTSEVFERFRHAGIVPVITHPERNRHLRHNLRRLARWIQRGCLLQITAQSLGGQFGESAQEAALTMIDARLVHFVASDAHNLEGRPPVLMKAYEFVADRWGDQEADRLFIDNPWAALWGDPLKLPAPRVKRRRSWSFFG
jgi:protein-tyrosine phosphatase